MVQPLTEQDVPLVIKFGGGIHSRASEDEIDEREAKSGQNFKLDLQNRELRNRDPFDLMGTAPNGSSINGFITLTQSDGTVKLAVQAGDTVYEYDGLSTFNNIGTVSASAKLRGRLEHQWQLTDKVLITDLALAETVKEWDGTTFQSVSFTDEVPAAFGNFFAKYLAIENERAVFANVIDVTTALPHLIVGSKRGDYTNISVSQRPSSALSEEDPYFIPSPDLHPINGLVRAFAVFALSTENHGSMFKLSGTNAKDFAFGDFFPRSAASGAESVAFVGNDIFYGRPGKIESLIATEKFGDVARNDLSLDIDDQIMGYEDWTIAYNARVDRVYIIPGGSQAEMWVFEHALADTQASSTRIQLQGGALSPWMKWTTQHPLSFQPTAIMPALDPQDGLEYTLMGDASGNIYRLEGTGLAGDGGSAEIQMDWLTKLYTIPQEAEAYRVEGYIKYRKNASSTVTLTMEYAGEAVFNESITIAIPAPTGETVWGGDSYWGGDFYYGTAFAGRLTRQKFGIAGQSNEFQLRVTGEGVGKIEINEIGLRLSAS